MSELRFESFTMPAAVIGGLNPHGRIQMKSGDDAPLREFDPGIDPDDMRDPAYGYRKNCLPYRLQDQFDCGRQPRAFEAAVLENDRLRALFLPELGGRLWSLLDKRTGRELLHVNPEFRPGNLALRNAWFSGGVEWNFCWRGHTPFTCDPLFVATARLDDGTPVLRMYEFERVRGIPYQMDFFLPDGAATLFARMAIRNPDARTVPVYWWSNIAVPEHSRHRVLTPADSVLRFNYLRMKMNLHPNPVLGGRDLSYPTNHPTACDNFYVIPDGRQAWIATVDESGRGLFQTSTKTLRGRKLFVWGQSQRGRNWQDFLNTPGHPYVEIQAGIERTQMTCRPLPPGESFEWLEAYGLLETDPAIAHGRDWERATGHAAAHIAEIVPQHTMEKTLERTRAMSTGAPRDVVRMASGWGALERLRREKSGERPFCGPALPFP
ncbi:MAG: DUF5107 domain-containing protein [Planctomycetota bacterium]